MDPKQISNRVALWSILIPAAVIMMVTMGSRQVTGLFLSPINTSTGIGIAGLSLAAAVGQFVWGATQPVFGALADRYGSTAVMILGAVLLTIGLGITPLMTDQLGMVFAMGVVSAAGAGAASFSILVGIAANRLAPEHHSFAAGFINAGGSFGQFVFAPITERIIAFSGWINAMFALAVASIATIPFILFLRAKKKSAEEKEAEAVNKPAEKSLRTQVREAMGDRSYLLIHIGFFTCGFHVAFLITHLPGEIALCGLPASVSGISIAIIGLANIVGSLGAGVLGSYFRMKYLLFWVYLARAVLILLYMVSPKDPITFYIFAAGLGLTFLATVGPTAGLVGKLFGARYLATLFGLTLLSHQTGAFLGAWLGGLSAENYGSYDMLWYADAVLALIAALVHLPIRESAPVRPMATA
jgi:predicted MFS family arabinose efflux permease